MPSHPDRIRRHYICNHCNGDGRYHGSPNYLSVDMVYNFCKWCMGTGIDKILYGYQNNDPGLWKNIVRSNTTSWRSKR